MQTALPILTPGRSRRSRRPLVALILVALTLAAVGAFIAAGIVRGGAPADQRAGLPNGPFGISQDIPTSFGALGVESVQKINALTPRALSSSTHGIAHLIRPGQVRVQTSVTFTNLLDKPVAYSPSQFRLIAGGKGKPLPPFSSSIHAGTLQPSASIDAVISFVVPANGKKLQMAFSDRGRNAPVLIDLGRVGKTTPDSAFDRFHHH